MQRSVQYGSIDRGCEEEGACDGADAEEGGGPSDAAGGGGMHPYSDGFPRQAIVVYRMPVVATFLGCLCCVVAVPWLLMALLLSWSDCSMGEWWSRPGVVCAASNASTILFTMTGGVFGLSASAERGSLGAKGKVLVAAVLGAQVLWNIAEAVSTFMVIGHWCWELLLPLSDIVICSPVTFGVFWGVYGALSQHEGDHMRVASLAMACVAGGLTPLVLIAYAVSLFSVQLAAICAGAAGIIQDECGGGFWDPALALLVSGAVTLLTIPPAFAFFRELVKDTPSQEFQRARARYGKAAFLCAYAPIVVLLCVAWQIAAWTSTACEGSTILIFSIIQATYSLLFALFVLCYAG